MDPVKLLSSLSFLWSPWTVTIMVGLAVLFVWISVAPAQKKETRLEDYANPLDQLDDAEMQKSFFKRVLWPIIRKILRLLGSLAPQRNIDASRELIMAAGGLGGMSPLDFLGIRLLFLALFGGGAVLLTAPSGAPILTIIRNAGLAALVGFFLPLLWLNSRVSARKSAIVKALPDALDMLTIGVEAGLAFESALLRVGEKWKNPLTLEFRRTVGEMRMGMPRAAALQRMAERTGVNQVSTFVAILIQSDALGVSIAEVLHSQAAQMRVWRRQRVQELAQQASVKMVFPLVFLVFPAMFIVILGPSIPVVIETFRSM